MGSLFMSTASAKRDTPAIVLNEDETLQVVFYYSADLKVAQSDPSMARSLEKQAQREFREAFEALLSEVKLPVAVEVVEQGKRPDKSRPLLTIQAIRWGKDSGNEVEAVISAKLQGEGKQKNKLGSFTARASVSSVYVEELVKEARMKAMTAVLVELLGELDKSFPSAVGAAPEGE